MVKNLKESIKYEIDVTSVDSHDVTNQRYFTGKGISSDPKDAKLYDSEEAAKADFKKVPKKFNGALIRDVRVAKRFVKESKKITENIDTWESDVDEILEKIDALEVPLEAAEYKYTLNKLVAIRHAINKTINEFQKLSVGESKKLVRESEGKFAAQYDKAASFGFAKDSVDPLMGVSVGDDDFCASKELEDEDTLIVLNYSDDWFDGKPGYIINIMSGSDGLFNTDPWNFNTCLKVARAFEKFAEDSPLTRRFLNKFADEYDLQYDEDIL